LLVHMCLVTQMSAQALTNFRPMWHVSIAMTLAT